MKTPKDFEHFLNSLPKPEKGQAEEIHGFNFSTTLDAFSIALSELRHRNEPISYGMVEYLLERCRRAESHRAPEDLREQVKAFCVAAMNSVTNKIRITGEEYYEKEFRKLCEPDLDSQRLASFKNFTKDMTDGVHQIKPEGEP